RAASRTGSWQKDRQELLVRSYGKHASVPVIILETCMEHPCQAIADVLTMREYLVSLKARRLTLPWCRQTEPTQLGTTHSLLPLAAAMGMNVTLAHPLGFEVDDAVLQKSRALASESGGSVQVVNDLAQSCRGAEVVYARSWASIKHWE